LGIENRKPKIEKKFSLSKPAITTKILFIYLFIFFVSARTAEGREGEGGGEGREGEGRGGRCVRADAVLRPRERMVASARTDLVLPQVTSKRTLQCVQVTDAPMAIV
jgi:hypothetical protein